MAVRKVTRSPKVMGAHSAAAPVQHLCPLLPFDGPHVPPLLSAVGRLIATRYHHRWIEWLALRASLELLGPLQLFLEIRSANSPSQVNDLEIIIAESPKAGTITPKTRARTRPSRFGNSPI